MLELDQGEMKGEHNAILAWVAAQHLLPGTACELVLPPEWAHASHNGIIQAARTTDGRHCILMKKRVGWKENFDGLFYCEGPLRSNEIIESPTATPYISLGGLGIFEELYISNRHNEQLFEVYFDLN